MLSLQSFSRLSVTCIIFWFNAYSIIKLFSFSTTFMERFPELGENFVFNYVTQTMYIDIYVFMHLITLFNACLLLAQNLQ